MLIPLSLENRINASAVIVEGKVLDQYCFRDPAGQNIYTSSRVKVLKSFKGNINADELEIITEGGTLGNEKHAFTSTLQLVKGQTGIFFCIPHLVQGGSKHLRDRSLPGIF